MPRIDVLTNRLSSKIVYYGPGLCGKTTNLRFIHEGLPAQVKGKLICLATQGDRTLAFDFLPLDLGTIRGMEASLRLYTVPGQVFYNETRKLVLQNADGIVFVADSQTQMMEANVESFRNLEDNLREHGRQLVDIPHVIQLNKRDLPQVASVEELDTAINRYGVPSFASIATSGLQVLETLRAITKLVIRDLCEKYDRERAPQDEAAQGAAAG